MREQYEKMGDEMIKALGFEHKAVIAYWTAFEKEQWLGCQLYYGQFKEGLY